MSATDVYIVDANLDDLSPPQFKKVIADLEPDLVGLTLLTNEYWKVLHIGASIIKELDPQIIRVIGGVYATIS